MAGQRVFVIDDFPGFYSGISKSRLPVGALVDWGEAKGNNRTLNILPSNEGELLSSGGYSLVGKLSAMSSANQMHGLFYWDPPRGGSRVIFAQGENFRYSVVNPTTSSPPSTPYEFAFAPFTFGAFGGWGSATTFSGRRGCFAPYGDRLYYCNGVDWPLVIPSPTATHVLPMGLADPISAVSPDSVATIHYSPYIGASDETGAEFQYYLTLVSDRGESPAIPVSGFIPTSANIETADRLFPVFSFPLWDNSAYDWVRSVNIYRTNGSIIPQFVSSILRGTGSYIDVSSQHELGYPLSQELGLPSNFRFMASFEDRMFAIGGFGNPNRVACSARGYPDQWPATNELVLPDTARNSRITGLKEINGSLYVLFEDKILRLRGSDPTNYVFDLVSSYIGVVAPDSVAEWQDGIVFLSRDGIYFFNGLELRRVSDPVQGLFRRQAPGLLAWSTAAGAIAADTYFLSYNESDETGYGPNNNVYPNRVLSVNMRNGRFGVRLGGGAFVKACKIDGATSLALCCLGATPTSAYMMLLSDYPTHDGGHANVVGDYNELVRLYTADIDMGPELADTVKVLESVEVFYEAIVPMTVAVTVFRSYPQTDAGATSESSSEAESVPTDTAAWGATWVGKNYGLSHLRRAKVFFDKMQGKSFNIGVTVTAGTNEVRVQKLVLRYRIEDPNWRGSGVLS